MNIDPKYTSVPTIAAFLVESKMELSMKLIVSVDVASSRNITNIANQSLLRYIVDRICTDITNAWNTAIIILYAN